MQKKAKGNELQLSGKVKENSGKVITEKSQFAYLVTKEFKKEHKKSGDWEVTTDSESSTDLRSSQILTDVDSNTDLWSCQTPTKVAKVPEKGTGYSILKYLGYTLDSDKADVSIFAFGFAIL